MEEGFLANPYKEGSENSDKSLFHAFIDYFTSATEEGNDKKTPTKTKKPIALKTKLKHYLENVPFDYSPLFELETEVNPELVKVLQEITVYDIIKGTKYFDNEEFVRVLDGVYSELYKGQIYAIFLLFELMVINKDRLAIEWTILQDLLKASVFKEKSTLEKAEEIKTNKGKTLPSISPTIELFAPFIAYFFVLHSPQLCYLEEPIKTLTDLILTINKKFISSYSWYFCLMHIKALVTLFQIPTKELYNYSLFMAVLDLLDLSLDSLQDNDESLLELGTLFESSLAPSVQLLPKSNDHLLITKVVEIIIKTVNIVNSKCPTPANIVSPILNLLRKITTQVQKFDQNESLRYIFQMICLKGLQSIIISLKVSDPRNVMESLTVLNDVVLDMLRKDYMSQKEIADVFKMILFPISEDYGKSFPPNPTLALSISEILCKSFLLVLDRIAKTHEMPVIWMNSLKHFLLLIDKAHKVQAIEFIETMIERIKNIIMTMVSMNLLSIINDAEDNSSAEKQLSLSSWKAIDAFLPDLKGEIAKALNGT